MKPLNNKGVTLVEAICALAILAIVGAMFAGAFTTMFNISHRAMNIADNTSYLNEAVNLDDMGDPVPGLISITLAIGEYGEPFPSIPINRYTILSLDDTRTRVWFTRQP